MGPAIVQSSLLAAIAVIVQTGIGFLGLGVPPPAPTWGGGIFDAAASLNDFPWLLVPSGGVVALTILTFGLLGDALRDTAVETWARPAHRKQARSRGDRMALEALFAGAPSAAVMLVHGLHIVTSAGAQQHTLVSDVSFELLPSETLGLAGESGSGKTLTILALMGLLPPGKQLAMIFQEPMAALDTCFTIAHHLIEVIRCHEAASPAQAQANAAACARRLSPTGRAPSERRQGCVHRTCGCGRQRARVGHQRSFNAAAETGHREWETVLPRSAANRGFRSFYTVIAMPL